MKQRTSAEIRKEALELLQSGEYIMYSIKRELGINNQLAMKILAELDQRGLLEMSIKPSKNNILCTHYHALSTPVLNKEAQE